MVWMNTHPYPSDLSDEEWAILGPLITPGKQAGHPQLFGLRRIVEAVFYLLRTGCQWRDAARVPALVHGVPPLRQVAQPGRLGADQRRAARAPSPAQGPQAPADGRDHRQPVRAHDRSGWPARLRRRQEGLRPQAAHPGGHGRQSAQGKRAPGRHPRPARRRAAARRPQQGVPAHGGSPRRRGPRSSRAAGCAPGTPATSTGTASSTSTTASRT
jgi:hypothetical protein